MSVSGSRTTQSWDGDKRISDLRLFLCLMLLEGENCLLSVKWRDEADKWMLYFVISVSRLPGTYISGLERLLIYNIYVFTSAVSSYLC